MEQTEYIYELVDATPPGYHYTIGLFKDKQQALEAAVSQETLDLVRHHSILYGCANLQIRKRAVDFGAYDNFNQVINISIWESDDDIIKWSMDAATETKKEPQ